MDSLIVYCTVKVISYKKVPLEFSGGFIYH